jgi:membrane protease YdiL (CAAX protease family)
LLKRFFKSPIVWMLVGGVAIMGIDGVCVGVGTDLGLPFLIAGSLVAAGLALVVYRVVMRFLAHRDVPELRFDPGELLRGAALGVAFLAASVLVVALLGGYTIAWQPINPARTLAFAIALNIGAAVCEELTFRGFLLQGIEGVSSPAIAVAITALVFGGVHALNPDASLWSSFAIALEAGVVTGTAFVWRRNLWFVIGLHFAWNTAEMLLGVPVSGHREPGLFITTVHGHPWLTGGDFGVEASVVPVILGVVLTAAMIARCRRP